MKLIVRTIVASFAFLLIACFPASFPADILAEYQCVQKQVESGDTNFGKIMLACSIQEEKIVMDAINALLSSKTWMASHPLQVVQLRATMKEHGR